ncbi:hypothetical protein GQ53DRAFT_727651 [Thozetella sp. PMI_491]|nr:hypothetical protein GQ53DRAFT_727651 [Thozetella sp. PMI_491]
MASNLPLWLVHPLLIVILQVSLITAVVGFTSSQSFLRPALLPFPFVLAALACQTCAAGLCDPLSSTFVISLVLANTLIYLDRTLLSRWDFAAGGPTRSFDKDIPPGVVDPAEEKLRGSLWARFRFGLNTATSRRHLNTPYEIKNSPHFSSKYEDYTPSRGAFLLRAAFVIALSYLLVDFCSLGPDVRTEESEALFAPDRVPLFSRLGQVTIEDMINRYVIGLMVWVNAYCVVQITYNLPAMVCVALGLTEVREWRPPFGSLSSLYSVRKFWGSFWHQFFRTLFSHPTSFLAHDVLRLPKTGSIPRYTKIFLTFFISGIMHLLLDLTVKFNFEKSGALRFYCMQTLGIMAEDVVQAVWTRVSRSSKKTLPPAWKRVVGFLWLWNFMMWTVPAWMFLYAREQQEQLFPFSVCGWLLGRGME